MKTLRIAFYKAIYGNWLDDLIASTTNGPYSHVELIFEDNLSFSSSPRKNGVNFRTATFSVSGPSTDDLDKIVFIESRWKILEIKVHNDEYDLIRSFCNEQVGKGYDYLGAIKVVLPFFPRDRKKWFCSEIIIAAFHSVFKWFEIREEISPNKMFDQIDYLKPWNFKISD